MDGVNGIDENSVRDPVPLCTHQQNLSRRDGTSLTQGTTSSRPDAVEGVGHSRLFSATGVQGEVVSPADHAQQVMSPNMSASASRFHGSGGFQESSSPMAARYNISGGDGEDELTVVERSTFEDLVSQFATSQGDMAGSARRGDKDNYVPTTTHVDSRAIGGLQFISKWPCWWSKRSGH